MTSHAKTAIVTGAGRGIGEEIARRLSADGMHVYGLDLRFSGGAPWMRQVSCDITAGDQLDAAVGSILAERGGVDVLVNNAGVDIPGSLADVDLAEVERGFMINVVGLLRVSQSVIPVMKAQRSGRIINAASFAAIVPAIGNGAYAASKSAVVQLTRVMAGELGPWGVTVNAYAPGMIPTAMNGFADLPIERKDELLDTLTLRRWGSANDVASLVAFLASPDASYITGALIDVSGGKLATQIPRRAYDGA